MNRSGIKCSVVSAILVASAGAPLLMQYQARVQWRGREAVLRQQAEQLAELSAQEPMRNLPQKWQYSRCRAIPIFKGDHGISKER